VAGNTLSKCQSGSTGTCAPWALLTEHGEGLEAAHDFRFDLRSGTRRCSLSQEFLQNFSIAEEPGAQGLLVFC